MLRVSYQYHKYLISVVSILSKDRQFEISTTSIYENTVCLVMMLTLICDFKFGAL